MEVSWKPPLCKILFTKATFFLPLLKMKVKPSLKLVKILVFECAIIQVSLELQSEICTIFLSFRIFNKFLNLAERTMTLTRMAIGLVISCDAVRNMKCFITSHCKLLRTLNIRCYQQRLLLG